MDVVHTTNGQIAIMDVGDGGVSGWKEWEASPQLLRLLAAWTEWHISRTLELEKLRGISGQSLDRL